MSKYNWRKYKKYNNTFNKMYCKDISQDRLDAIASTIRHCLSYNPTSIGEVNTDIRYSLQSLVDRNIIYAYNYNNQEFANDTITISIVPKTSLKVLDIKIKVNRG